MGFFEKIRSGRLFFGKKEPTTVLSFLFKGKSYIVEKFDLEFHQEVDRKGRPDSPVMGGIITLTISDTPDESINLWMIDTYRKEDGELRFLKNSGPVKEGALLHISFKEAYCVEYHKTISPQGAGTQTTLVIAPRILKIGEEEVELRGKN